MRRACCDGRCDKGRNCPAFAPGVIAGPFYPVRPLTVTWLMRLLRALRRMALRRRSPL